MTDGTNGPLPFGVRSQHSVSSRFSHTEIRPHDEEKGTIDGTALYPEVAVASAEGGVSPGHVNSTSGYLRYLSPRIFFHTGCDCPYPEGL